MVIIISCAIVLVLFFLESRIEHYREKQHLEAETKANQIKKVLAAESSIKGLKISTYRPDELKKDVGFWTVAF